MVLCTKRKNSDTHSGRRLWRAFNYGQVTQEPNMRKQVCCELHARWGGVAKKWRMMARGRGGVHDTPQNWWPHLWTAPYWCDSSIRGYLHFLCGSESEWIQILWRTKIKEHLIWANFIGSAVCKKFKIRMKVSGVQVWLARSGQVRCWVVALPSRIHANLQSTI